MRPILPVTAVKVRPAVNKRGKGIRVHVSKAVCTRCDEMLNETRSNNRTSIGLTENLAVTNNWFTHFLLPIFVTIKL